MARRDTAPRRYADAAFEIGLRDGDVDRWRRELDQAAATLAEADVEAALANPATPLDQRLAAAERVFGDLSPKALNLVLLLVRRGRIEQLPRVAAEFRRLDDERNGIVHATATSASPLGPDEVRAVTARLQELTGAKVTLETAVDPDLLGGLVVRIGDRLIDASVRGRLERLRSRLATGAAL